MKFVAVLRIVFTISLCLVGTLGTDCESDMTVWCYSSRIMRTFVKKLNQLKSPLIIYPGLKIHSTRDMGPNDSYESGDLFDQVDEYLRHHEISIKMSELLNTTILKELIRKDVNQSGEPTDARKKEDKTYLMATSLFFGKLLAVLGIGGIGAMAMKALAIASMALLMAGMVGMKSLSNGQEEHSHHVQYVSEGHHRRRRQARTERLAYRGWPITSN